MQWTMLHYDTLESIIKLIKDSFSKYIVYK